MGLGLLGERTGIGGAGFEGLALPALELRAEGMEGEGGGRKGDSSLPGG